MRSFLRFFIFSFLLFTYSLNALSQVLVHGTKSNRVDESGTPTNTYYDMTGWDSSPYEEFYWQNGTAFMNFRILYPTGYNPELKKGDAGYKEYPLLFFLHGAGEAGIAREGSFAYGVNDPEYLNNDYNLYHGGQQQLAAVQRNPSDSKAFPGFILVPQMRTGWDALALNQAIGILELVIDQFSVDKNRVYMHGLSAGGTAVWKIAEMRPTIFAAIAPISATKPGTFNNDSYKILMPISIWQFQGSLDSSPTATASQTLQKSLKNAGGTPRYTEYANMGHGIWNTAWSEPDFFSWLLQKSKTDIHPYEGKTAFCSDEVINTTLHLTPGFTAYEWRKDGALIDGAKSSELVVTELGNYTARFSRNGEWTEWSSPIEIKRIPSPEPPVITANGTTALLTYNALDGKKNVILSAPEGMAAYLWSNNAITQSITVSGEGTFKVVVTAQNGCKSPESQPVVVSRKSNNGLAGTPATPTGSGVTAISETELRVEWNDNSSDETAFEVYRSTNTSSGYQFISFVSSNSTAFIDKGLDASTPYFYRLRAINNSGGSDYSTAISGTTKSDLTPPSAPSNLKIVSNTTSSINLEWNNATDNVAVTEYQVFVNGKYETSAIGTTITINGLTHEQLYYFTVKAKDKAGNISLPSNQVTKLMKQDALYYQLFLGGTWEKIADLASWNASKTGYISNFIIDAEPAGVRNPNDEDYFGFTFDGYIYISTAGSYTFYTSSDDGSVLYIDDQLVVNNDGLHGTQEVQGSVQLTVGAHKIKVSYFERTGGQVLNVSYSGPNISKRAIPDNVLTSSPLTAPGQPVAPSNLSITGSTATTLTLRWDDNSNNESGFEVYRSTSSADKFEIVGTTSANITSLVDGGLSPLTTYYYKIRAIGTTGESAYSNTVSAATAKDPNIPAAPSGLVASAVSNSSVSLSWTDNSDNEKGFEIYRVASEGDSYELIAAVQNNVSSYLDTNLDPLSIYYYKIKAINGVYLSAFSNIASTTTWPNIPQAPSGLSSSALSSRSVKIVWIDNSTTEEGFRVYRGQSEQDGYVLVSTVQQDQTSFVDETVLPDVKYNYKVASFNKSGESGFSNVLSVNTLPEKPATPVLLSAVAVSKSEIKLVWQDNSSNEARFIIYRSAGSLFEKIDSVTSNITTYTDKGLMVNVEYSYKITAVNVGGESGFSNITSKTIINTAPVLQAVNNIEVHETEVFKVIVSAQDAEGDVIVLSAKDLPSFATFTDHGNGAGSISLAPGDGSEGLYKSKITASDNIVSSSLELTIVVNKVPVSNSPVISGIENVTLKEGETKEMAVSVTDEDNDIVSITVSGLPSFVSYTIKEPGIVFSFEPANDAAGEYNDIKIQAEDAAGNIVISTFSITVVAATDNDPILGIEDGLSEKRTITAYPNPFTDKLTIQLQEQVSGEVKFTLVDLLGKVHFAEVKRLVSQDKVELNVSGRLLNKNIYFLKVETKGKEQVVRLLKK